MAKTANRIGYLSAETASIALSIVLFSSVLFIRCFAIFSHGSDLSGVESNVVYSVIRLLDKGNLYTDPGFIPFSITQYTPIYYFICASTAKLIHASALTDIYQLYIIGRTWSLIFNILTAIGVAKIGSRLFNLPLRFCLLAGIASFVFLFPHNFVVRPDSLHDTFSIWSVYFFLLCIQAGETGKRMTLLFFAVLLAAAALYTKQNGVQLILIFLFHFMINTNWKMILLLAVFVILLIALPLWILLSFNSSFIKNVVGGIQNGVDFKNFYTYILGRKLFILQLLPFSIASFYICLKKKKLFRAIETERFLCLAVLGTFFFAMLTALKKGSNLQYYVVFSDLALLLILGYLNQLRLAEKTPRYRILQRTTFFGLNIMMLGFTFFAVQHIFIVQGQKDLKMKELAAVKVADYLQFSRGLKIGEYVFANLSTDYTIPPRGNLNNLLSRNCVVPQLDILNYSTGLLKVFGYANFEKAMITGRIKYIVESDPANIFSISENFHRLREDNYRLLTKIDGYFIYIWKWTK